MRYAIAFGMLASLAGQALAKPLPVVDSSATSQNITSRDSDAHLSITFYEFAQCSSDVDIVVTPTFDLNYEKPIPLADPASDGKVDDQWRVWGSFAISRGLKKCEQLAIFASGHGTECDPAGLIGFLSTDTASGPGCWNTPKTATCVFLHQSC